MRFIIFLFVLFQMQALPVFGQKSIKRYDVFFDVQYLPRYSDQINDTFPPFGGRVYQTSFSLKGGYYLNRHFAIGLQYVYHRDGFNKKMKNIFHVPGVFGQYELQYKKLGAQASIGLHLTDYCGCDDGYIDRDYAPFRRENFTPNISWNINGTYKIAGNLALSLGLQHINPLYAPKGLRSYAMAVGVVGFRYFFVPI